MIDEPKPEHFVPIKQAAKMLGLSEAQLYRAIRDGNLPAYKFGAWKRVRVSDVSDWVESCRVDPAELRLVIDPRNTSRLIEGKFSGQ